MCVYKFIQVYISFIFLICANMDRFVYINTKPPILQSSMEIIPPVLLSSDVLNFQTSKLFQTSEPQEGGLPPPFYPLLGHGSACDCLSRPPTSPTFSMSISASMFDNMLTTC